MKICLIQPPIEDFYTTPARNLPLGLLSLAAMLKGHQLQILDLRYGRQTKIPPPAELQEVLPFYHPEDASPFGLYKNFYRFGPANDEIRATLPRDCELFLITALCTTYADMVYELIDIIKECVPHARIVIGGAHATVLPDEVLNAGADFVIRGESEFAIKSLVTELEKAVPNFYVVPNLVWRENGSIRSNPVQFIDDLDALPFPDYNLTGLPAYELNGQRHAMLIASRGCPYHCTFCGIRQTMGVSNRRRSVENILAEMTQLYNMGIRSFDFEDDHFGGEQDWLIELLDGIVARFGAGQLTLSAMNGITASNFDETILRKMRLAGFQSLNLSLVTPSIGRQRELRRPFGTEMMIELITLAHSLGFDITTYLIIGLPGDTAAEILHAILFLSSQPVLIGPSLFYLVPGAELFNEIAAKGQIPTSRLKYRATFFPVESAECDRAAAMTLFRLCRLINFLKGLIDRGFDFVSCKIINDHLIIPGQCRGRAARRAIGIALLRHFFRTGQLCGTRRIANGEYLLVPEKVNQGLLDEFLSSDWSVSGIHSDVRLKKVEIIKRILTANERE